MVFEVEPVRSHVLGSVAAAQADVDESGGDVGDVGCCCGVESVVDSGDGCVDEVIVVVVVQVK